jgi:hypothetical protein
MLGFIIGMAVGVVAVAVVGGIIIYTIKGEISPRTIRKIQSADGLLKSVIVSNIDRCNNRVTVEALDGMCENGRKETYELRGDGISHDMYKGKHIIYL